MNGFRRSTENARPTSSWPLPTPYVFHKGRIISWEEGVTHFLTHSMHYGDSAIEGIRCYVTKNGPAFFRLKDHMHRLHASVKPLHMSIPYSPEELCQIATELIRRNNLEQSYMRPIAYYDCGGMGLYPGDNTPCVSIACWQRGAFAPHESIDVKISSFIRLHPKSTFVGAKLGGHYLNSIFASLEIRGSKYHEALLCDYEGNIAEAPGANIFVVKDNVLFTPPKKNILPGITRATILELAQDLGIEVHEQILSVDSVLAADEAFFTGTAVEILPIRSIDDHVLGNGKPGLLTRKLKLLYDRIVRGEEAKYLGYLTFVNVSR